MKASTARWPEVCRDLTADLTEAESLFYLLLCLVLMEPWALAQISSQGLSLRPGKQAERGQRAGRDKGLRLGGSQSKLCRTNEAPEANAHSAKTVCTAGAGLWRAKGPPRLVLGNFTLGPPKAKTPGSQAPASLCFLVWYPSYCSCMHPSPQGCGP